jgi:Pirin C-terminal cupin domain
MKLGRGTVSGKPLEEPVAWYGLIVINTQEQLGHAFEELRERSFLNASAYGRACATGSRDRRAYGYVT